MDSGTMQALDRRNRRTFGIGTMGRDAVYTLITMYLVFYLTEVVRPGDTALLWVTGMMLAARLIDSVMDFVMGSIVDDTRTRWGQYNPWILGGGIAASIMSLLLFTPLGLTGGGFVAAYCVIYLVWGFAWTTNDIPYWSLVPALSVDQHQRERLSATAKVWGTFGLFAVAGGIMPISTWLTQRLGSGLRAWFVIALVLVVVSFGLQLITVIGVRQPPGIKPPSTKLGVRAMLGALRANDQMTWIGICMVLFGTGYMTTSMSGTYFFKYSYRDENMYAVFAVVMGVAQLVGYATFTTLARRIDRSRIYALSMATVLLGYVCLFLSPMHMVPLGISGFLIFLGGAWLVMVLMVNLSDTVEYGQWRTGRRSSALTFALNPFIWKASGALAMAIVAGMTVASGISRAGTPADVGPGGLLVLKLTMTLLPAILIVISWVLFSRHYTITKDRFDEIVAELRERGDLAD